MDHTQIITSVSSPAPITQHGERSMILQNSGTVNIYQHPPVTQTGRLLSRIQGLSTEYYQLIVTPCNFMDAATITISPYESLTKASVPEEIYDRCATLTNDGCEELMHYPALICNENKGYHGITGPGQEVLYAILTEIRPVHMGIQIGYTPVSFFSQKILVDYHTSFDIRISCEMTDLNRPSWTVHKTNLFQAFTDANLSDMPAPQFWRSK